MKINNIPIDKFNADFIGWRYLELNDLYMYWYSPKNGIFAEGILIFINNS